MTRLPHDNPLVKQALGADTSAPAKPSTRGNIRTWSEVAGRWFDSKGECKRAEELCLLQKAGEIILLTFQYKIVLSLKPRVSITIDFSYLEKDNSGEWQLVYEDYKAIDKRTGKARMEEVFRVKLAWLKQRCGADVRITGG